MPNGDSGGTSIARLRGKVVETGQDVAVDVPRRRKRQKGWRDRVGLVDLTVMTRLECSALEYRVLFAVMQAIPEKGGCHSVITVNEIAEQIGSTPSSVSRTMASLQKRSIVLREGRKVGRLIVNPWIMYNGDFDSWNSETEKFDEPMWARGVDRETGVVS